MGIINNHYTKNIAKTLNRFMKAKKITAEKLSELSGVAVGTINRYRQGVVADPQLGPIIAICDVINISIDEMLDRDCCSIDETLMMNYHLLAERDKKIADLLLGDDNKED